MSDSNSTNSMAEVLALMLTRMQDKNAAKTESADAAMAAFQQVIADVQMKGRKGNAEHPVCPLCGEEVENTQPAPSAPKTRRRPIPMLDESLNDVRQAFVTARDELRLAKVAVTAEAKAAFASSTLVAMRVALRERVSALVPIEVEARTAYVQALVRVLQSRYRDTTSRVRIEIVTNPKKRDLKITASTVSELAVRNTYVTTTGKSQKKTVIFFTLCTDDMSDETMKLIGAQFGLLLV